MYRHLFPTFSLISAFMAGYIVGGVLRMLFL
jgi:hypothetical protein